MDAGDLERLLERERWEDAGESLGQHRLAGAGRADHQHVVATGGGDLERALDRLLSLDIGEVWAADVLHGEQLGEIDLLGFDRLAALEECGGLAKVREG